MNNFSSIVFYFPFHDIGGVSVLFLRLADYLKDMFPVYIADYSDGYMALNRPAGVDFICIDQNQKFPDDCLVVFQSFLPWRFPYISRVSFESRVLFWNLHPKNFDPSIFNQNHKSILVSNIAKFMNLFSSSRKRKLKDIVEYLVNRNALYFMDSENVRSTCNLLNTNIRSPKYLPVPVPKIWRKKKTRVSEHVVNCAWVGRICDFKYSILEHLIIRLRNASKQIGPICLKVIGDGEYLKYIKDFTLTTVLDNERFRVDFVGERPLVELPKYLSDNVDIIFAMGTSALEGARIGIPVFLVDYSYNKIEKLYRFRYLFDNSGYCLGREINSNYFEENSSLEGALHSALTNYEFYSEKCYEYWLNKFSLDVVGPQFIDSCNFTRATFGEMVDRGYFAPDFLGLFFRSISCAFRKDLRNDIVGFRSDC